MSKLPEYLIVIDFRGNSETLSRNEAILAAERAAVLTGRKVVLFDAVTQKVAAYVRESGHLELAR